MTHLTNIAAEGLCKCDNCGHRCNADTLNAIRDIVDRVEAGGLVPAGECPKCGALAYQISAIPVPPEDHMALWEAILDMRAKLPSIARHFDSHGTCQVRTDVLKLTRAAQTAWESLDDENRDSLGGFDWEYLPNFLAARERLVELANGGEVVSIAAGQECLMGHFDNWNAEVCGAVASALVGVGLDL